MGILDICLKQGKHIATIMLLCENGRIPGEDFGFGDITYIAGYRGVAFRVKVRQGEGEEDYVTKRIDFRGASPRMAVFRVEKKDEVLTIPVSAIVEIVSQE
ncbi:hypothetical protein [Candidatus Pyrohabitans sp.]